MDAPKPVATLAAALACGVLARPAIAVETAPLGGEPARVDLTVSTGALYNFDNRNSRPGNVSRVLDDDWGLAYARLDTQASWKKWDLGLRLDGAWFYARKDPTDVAKDLLRERHGGSLPASYTADDAAFFSSRVVEASRELTTRHTDWLYPAKYHVGYSNRDVEATVGDFYAQLGRGLVLSVRKLDELSSDTTVRGGRVTGRLRAGDLRFRVTGLGGTSNPLRIDEASGRFLGVSSAVTGGFATVTEAGMPRAQASPFETAPAPTFAPDRIVGAELEGGTRAVTAAVQGSLLDRDFGGSVGESSPLSPGVVRGAKSIRTASASLNAPDLGGHGAAYVEIALQDLAYPSEVENRAGLPDPGHAVYASLSTTLSPVTLGVEAKHYRRFFPLLANVDLSRAPEFSGLQYSAPPTTEAFYVDTEFEGMNTCVTGGRFKADFLLGARVNLFAWAGRYDTWAESVANENCRTRDANLNRVWDTAVGLELTGRDRKSRTAVTMGTRFDDADRLLGDVRYGGQTHVYYREQYVRHDVIEHLGGPFALKIQGYFRSRYLTQGGPGAPWKEGQEIAAVDWNSRVTVGAGIEYTTNAQFPPRYFNGMLGYALGPASSLSLFVGQRRGGLRCVSGVCRVYPPFEGARLDATFRF